VNAVADGDAIPAGRLEDPDDVDALRMAIELKSAQPAADLPSEQFVAKLRRDLANEGAPAGRRGISRRAILTSAGVAAGAAAAGAIGVAVDRTLLSGDGGSGTPHSASLDPVNGEWLGVANDAELAGGAPQRFATASLVGFVTATGDGVVAVSAACTHQGCILQSNDEAGRFDCPCHRTAFSHDGRLLFSQLPDAPAPLTRLQVRRRDGSVEVYVPRPL
jgi:Rieske Fe-S protein